MNNTEQFNKKSSRVAIIPDPEIEKTKSGFILPASSKTKVHTGIVNSIADESEHKFQVAIGDHVMFERAGAVPVNIDGVNMLVMDEHFIYLKFCNHEI